MCLLVQRLFSDHCVLEIWVGERASPLLVFQKKTIGRQFTQGLGTSLYLCNLISRDSGGVFIPLPNLCRVDYWGGDAWRIAAACVFSHVLLITKILNLFKLIKVQAVCLLYQYHLRLLKTSLKNL